MAVLKNHTRNLKTVQINIKPFFVLKVLLLFILLLSGLHLLGLYLGAGVSPRFMVQFDFNQEANIPAFFSAINLFLCALLLLLTSLLKQKSGSPMLSWAFLGLIFLFLSVDEAAGIHEMIMGMTRRALNLSGYIYYAWIVPYGLGVVLLTALLVPFFKDLPKRTRSLFLTSGAIFLTGSVGFEMLGGNIIQSQGPTALYSFYYTCEEMLEMIGSSLFIYALLDHITGIYGSSISIGRSDGSL